MASILLNRIYARSLSASCSRKPCYVLTRPYSSKPPINPQSESEPPAINSKKTMQPSLDIDIVPEVVASNQTGRTGAKSSRNSLSSFEKRRRAMGRAALGALGLGVVFGIFYMGREWERDELLGRTK